MGKRIANVWAVPCPTCFARTDAPCEDLSTRFYRPLFGRRTHRERARKVKEMTPTTSAGVITGPVTITTGTTSAMIDPVWRNWTATPSTTITMNTVAFDQTVWNNWVTSMTSAGTAVAAAVQSMRPPALTEEDRERRRQRDEQRRQDIIQQERERRARQERAEVMRQALREKRELASARAMALLRSVVPDENYIDRGDVPYLAVTGSSGGMYRVRLAGIHGNILQVDEHGCVLASLCGAPRQNVYTDYAENVAAEKRGDLLYIPDGDAWLGQYLSLKYNEVEYLRAANRSRARQCTRLQLNNQALAA